MLGPYSARQQLTDRDKIGARADQDVRLSVLDITQILAGAISPDDPIAGFPAWPDNDCDRRRRSGSGSALRGFAHRAAG
jgi:hypothetical protein